MKVKELMEHLQEYPQDLDVVYEDSEYGDTGVYCLGIVDSYNSPPPKRLRLSIGLVESDIQSSKARELHE